MLYIKKFNTDTDRERYIKNNFVSPHLFMNAQNRNVNYFPKYKRLSYISSTKTGGQYIDLGCKAVEMETYALLYNAKKFYKKATSILTISDSLITHEEIDSQAREQKLDEMIVLALESIIKL